MKKNNEINRNSLVIESIKIIKEIKPKIFVFENVSVIIWGFIPCDTVLTIFGEETVEGPFTIVLVIFDNICTLLTINLNPHVYIKII